MQTRNVGALVFSVVGLLTVSHASAVPVMIDFTDSRWSGASGQTSYSQSYGSLDVELSASGAMTFNAADAPTSGPASLALGGDGIGIGDDEISWHGGQSIDVNFNSGVTVLGYYFLDFFGGEGPNGMGELAQALFDTGGIDPAYLDVGAANGDVGFYAREGLSATNTTRISFSAASLEGPFAYLSGFSDFALAGVLVDYGAVKVAEPGTLALLGIGLVGLSFRRGQRRRSAVALADAR